MSFKEVIRLRKEGRLEEATNMAREDLAQVRNQWSCKALFWCLYDETKTATVEHLAQLAAEMQGLLDTIGSDDAATRCMQHIEKRLIPHTDKVREAAESAKTPENAPKAYDTILSIFNAGELHESLHTEFAWVIYRVLHADQSENVEYRKDIIEVYKQLSVERPSILHSLVLGEAVRVEKEWPLMFMFTEFIAWWGLGNLTADDWANFTTADGKSLMSRVEKMIYLYTKEIQSVEKLFPSEEFMKVLDDATKKWSKDDNLIRCKAMLLIKQGDKENAIALYKKIITLTSGQKPYVWVELANLLDGIDLKIGLLSKALLLKAPEEFLGKYRAQLAQLLCSKGLYSNALYEIEKVNAIYRAKGWHLPSEIDRLSQMIPLGTVACDNASQYPKWAMCADEYMYADLPLEYMVKVAHKEEFVTRNNGKQQKIIKWTLINKNGETIVIKPSKFNLPKTDMGGCFETKKSNGNIVFIAPTDANNIDWRKQVKGVISIKVNKAGKKFGFVDECYVPEKLIGQIQNGTNVECVAICQNNKWQCVSVKQVGMV